MRGKGKQGASRSQPCGEVSANAEIVAGLGAEHSAAERFKLFTPRMPTEAELREASLRWFGHVGDTLIDHWPPEVMALSMPTLFVRCPVDLVVDALWGDAPDITRLSGLADELDAAMGWDRKFVRLNSRSPKDAPWPFETPATCSGKEALGIIACSERMLADLCSFRHIPEHPAYICLREFVSGLRIEREYRCFVKDGELIAVTHYDYQNPIAPPGDGGAEVRAVIDAYFAEKLKPRLHVQTVVFDLYLPWSGEPLLIELNPYGLSDPCWLKSYQGVENFSGHVAFSDTAERSGLARDTVNSSPSKVTKGA